MPKKLISLIAFGFFVGIALLGATRQVRAQAPSTLYPSAAPLTQYLVPDKASEIELARSAAPASISAGAEVLVLTKDGYVTAVKGGNGLSVWWSEHGPSPLMIRSSGTPKSKPLTA